MVHFLVGLAEIMWKTCFGRDSYAFPESFSIFFLDTEPAYISQPPLHLGEVRWLSSSYWNMKVMCQAHKSLLEVNLHEILSLPASCL